MYRPDVTRLRIGDIELAVISDGRLRMDANLMFGPAQPAEWREQVHLHDGHVEFSVNCVMVRVGERRILLDTGTGHDVPSLMERYGGECGHLVDNLRSELGLTPGDVDTVVISHAHGDHIGGATIETVPTFPEALYWFSETEWEHWLQPDIIAERPFLAGKLPPLMDYGQVELAEDEVEVAPGVRSLFAPGHTPWPSVRRDHGRPRNGDLHR